MNAKTANADPIPGRNYAMAPSTRAATYVDSNIAPPDDLGASGTRTWITRGTNFVVEINQVRSGAVLTADCPDEHIVIVPAGGVVTITTGDAAAPTEQARTPAETGDVVFIVPPGASTVRVETDGSVVRVFSHLASAVADKAGNAAAYADGAPEVAPLRPWPAPVDGFRLRTYDLDRIPIDPISPGHSIRSTNLMVNLFRPVTKRRSEQRMSPHSHVDFEQGSLTLQGDYVHHLRYPWSVDKAGWREDEHHRLSSPSITIIPAGVIHTSQDVGEGRAQMADIFSPPRADFASIPGFSVNADEYPLPDA